MAKLRWLDVEGINGVACSLLSGVNSTRAVKPAASAIRDTGVHPSGLSSAAWLSSLRTALVEEVLDVALLVGGHVSDVLATHLVREVRSLADVDPSDGLWA
jgi:hypothetical protein